MTGLAPPRCSNVIRGGKVVDLVAIAGHSVSFEFLQEGAVTRLDVSAREFLDLVDEALSATLLEESGFNYRFSHALFREGVRAQLSAGAGAPSTRMWRGFWRSWTNPGTGRLRPRPSLRRGRRDRQRDRLPARGGG